MELAAALLDFVLHLDARLAAFVAQHGAWVYALLFGIIFVETGVVVWPWLPGDSLLFVVGALAAAGGMHIGGVIALLVAAALLGDNCNYWIGRWAGPKVFHFERSRWLNPAHLRRTHDFYERHGGKTVVIARFVPIVRTFAPFVAGIGRMAYLRYLAFCVGGAVLWVGSLTLAGYFFGELEIVKRNLGLVIVAIVIVSVMPMVLGYVRARRKAV